MLGRLVHPAGFEQSSGLTHSCLSFPVKYSLCVCEVTLIENHIKQRPMFSYLNHILHTFFHVHLHQIPDMQYPAIEALGPLDFGGDNADLHAENDILHQGMVSKDSIAKILH